MDTRIIILLALGAIILGGLVWIFVRAWRYRKNHPDEIYWPYNDPKESNEKMNKNEI